MKVVEQKESHGGFERTVRVDAASPFCPAGAMHGYSSVSVSARGTPISLLRAEKARFWDVDENEYREYVCAYGFMVLGYGHPTADEATGKQLGNGNTVSLAPAVAALDEIWKTDAPARMLGIGARVTDGLVRIARGHGYDLRVTGVPSMPFLRIANEEAPVFTEGVSALHKGLHADWISECVQRGAYFLSYHNNFVSAAHTDEDIQRTRDIADDAFRALRKR